MSQGRAAPGSRPAEAARARMVRASALVAVLAGGLAPAAAQAVDGAALFARSCAACHGAQGEGTPGLAPALAGALGPLLSRAEGRDYVLGVLLYGLSGKLVSQGQTFQGAMPSQSAFNDAELATLVRHLAGKLNGLPEEAPGSRTTESEVAGLRARQPAPGHAQLRALRAQVLR